MARRHAAPLLFERNMTGAGMGDTGQNDALLDAVLKSLSDPTRRQILARLSSKGELQVHALTSPRGLSPPAPPHHPPRLTQAPHLTTRPAAHQPPPPPPPPPPPTPTPPPPHPPPP